MNVMDLTPICLNKRYISLTWIIFAFTLLFLYKNNEDLADYSKREEDSTPQIQMNEQQFIGQNHGTKMMGLHSVKGVCSKGDPPWNNQWIKSQLKEFIAVYNRRPAENTLGTPLMHQFALWCIVRHLAPKHIIESGVHRGLGTWLLRKAAPNTQLILVDPKHDLDLVYEDMNNDTLYFTGRKFRDFGSMQHWRDVDIDFNQTLAFIDDHHTPLIRIPHAHRVGIRHMIFEDNYWIGFSDCFSLKQACACVMGWKECEQFKYKNAFGTQTRPLRDSDVQKARHIFESMEIYSEFPMIWNAWHPGVTLFAQESENYLYSETNGTNLLASLGLTRFPPKSHMDGRYTYGNIAYVKLSY